MRQGRKKGREGGAGATRARVRASDLLCALFFLRIAMLGMNGGSALASNKYAVRGVINTQLSMCAAVFTW